MPRIINRPSPLTALAKLARSSKNGIKSAASATRSIGRSIRDAVRGTNPHHVVTRRKQRDSQDTPALNEPSTSTTFPKHIIGVADRHVPSAEEESRSNRQQALRAAIYDIEHKLAKKYGEHLSYDAQRALSQTIYDGLGKLRFLDEVKPNATETAHKFLERLGEDKLPPLEKVLEDIEAIFTPAVDQGERDKLEVQDVETSDLQEQWATQELIGPKYQLKSKIRALDVVTQLAYEPRSIADQKIEDATGAYLILASSNRRLIK